MNCYLDTTQADVEIVCTRIHNDGKRTTLRIKVISKPNDDGSGSSSSSDDESEHPNPEVIFSVTDVSNIEQGRGGFVDCLKTKHEDLADEQANSVRRDSFRKDDLAASIAEFQLSLEANSSVVDPGQDIVRAFAAQFEDIAVEQMHLARRGSTRVALDLPDFEEAPNLGRRHSGFVTTSTKGYGGITSDQASTSRRGSARAVDLKSQLDTLLPNLQRRNSGYVDSMKSKHEDLVVSSTRTADLEIDLQGYKPTRRGSARIDDLAKQFDMLKPGSDVTIQLS